MVSQALTLEKSRAGAFFVLGAACKHFSFERRLMIVAKRSKEEREEERKKELLRTLRRGPDLDRFIDEQKRNFVSYAQGARMYSMNYYSFVKLAKEAGANIRIKKNVVIDLELIEKYLENNCEVAEGEN